MIDDKDENLHLIIGKEITIPLKYIFGSKFFVWILIF
jgi:hypothetical protein